MQISTVNVLSIIVYFSQVDTCGTFQGIYFAQVLAFNLINLMLHFVLSNISYMTFNMNWNCDQSSIFAVKGFKSVNQHILVETMQLLEVFDIFTKVRSDVFNCSKWSEIFFIKDAALVWIFSLNKDSKFSPEDPGLLPLQQASSKLFREALYKNCKFGTLFWHPGAGLGLLCLGDVLFLNNSKRLMPSHSNVNDYISSTIIYRQLTSSYCQENITRITFQELFDKGQYNIKTISIVHLHVCTQLQNQFLLFLKQILDRQQLLLQSLVMALQTPYLYLVPSNLLLIVLLFVLRLLFDHQYHLIQRLKLFPLFLDCGLQGSILFVSLLKLFPQSFHFLDEGAILALSFEHLRRIGWGSGGGGGSGDAVAPDECVHELVN